MADVVFVTPNLGGLVREEPVGTLLLATILRNAGIPVNILQFHHFGDVNDFESFLDRAVNEVFERNPHVVSFYTRCDTYHISLKIAQRIKAKSKDVYVVFAGPQADLSSVDTLREIPYVDFICCGEGETTIVPFFTSLIAGKPDLKIRGLVYRLGDDIIKNPRPDLIPDLDALPAIDYSLLEFEENENYKIISLFPVDVGRGCPFGCTYCSTKTFWGRKYRLKSAERIIEEIIDIHNRFGVTKFNFEHDMFTMNRNKVIQICGMLKNIGFPVHWRCSARMDCLDEELIDIMVDAGMKVLFVGIETGSPRMQKLIQKNLKLDDIPEKLRYISSKGVVVYTSFIFGFPNETEEDFCQTMALMMQISKLPHVITQPHLCTFLAGTEMTNLYYNEMVRASVLSDATGEVAVKECEDLINAHPVLFPHYFEYKTEFREKVKFFPQFFQCWNVMYPVYEYIAAKYEKNRLCDMLYDFTAANFDILQTNKDTRTILKNDKFIEMFSDDEKYELLKEAARFLVWKEYAKNGSRDIFGVDVKALLDGAEITDLKKTPVVATYSLNDENKGEFSFYNIKR